jgi:hypothetical protein
MAYFDTLKVIQQISFLKMKAHNYQDNLHTIGPTSHKKLLKYFRLYSNVTTGSNNNLGSTKNLCKATTVLGGTKKSATPRNSHVSGTKVLWRVDWLLGNDRETSSYKTGIVK